MTWVSFTEPSLAQKPFGIRPIVLDDIERGAAIFAKGHRRGSPFFGDRFPIAGVEMRMLVEQGPAGQLGYGPLVCPAIVAEQLADRLFVFPHLRRALAQGFRAGDVDLAAP